MADLPPDPSAIPWPAVIIAILTLIYITCVRPLRNKKQKDPLTQNTGKAMLSQQRAVERDMTALLLEYETMMRTMTAQLETRVAKMELLMREADERIAAMKSANAAAAQTARGDVSTQAAAPARITEEQKPDYATTIAAAVQPTRASGAAPRSEPTEPRHDDVYILADEGLTFRQISHRLERPYGEIELILALRPKEAIAKSPLELIPQAVVDPDSAPPDEEMEDERRSPGPQPEIAGALSGPSLQSDFGSAAHSRRREKQRRKHR